jgi:hypothetical protein
MGFGLVVGLIGGGVGAAFTDTATAVANINVGTFGMTISAVAPTGGTAVVSLDLHTVTISCPTIQSSAAGSCVSAITITSTGSVPLKFGVAVSAVTSPFTSAQGPLPMVANPTLTQGQTFVFNGGLVWPELGNAQLGQSYSVTYTITAQG